MELKERLEQNGCPKVVVFDLARCDMSEAVEDAFRYGKLVLATTTYNSGIFPFMREFIFTLAEHNYQNRTIAFIENGTWAPNATKTMKSMLEKCKNLIYSQNEVKILSSVTPEVSEQLESLAKELCKE